MVAIEGQDAVVVDVDAAVEGKSVENALDTGCSGHVEGAVERDASRSVGVLLGDDKTTRAGGVNDATQGHTVLYHGTTGSGNNLAAGVAGHVRVLNSRVPPFCASRVPLLVVPPVGSRLITPPATSAEIVPLLTSVAVPPI